MIEQGEDHMPGIFVAMMVGFLVLVGLGIWLFVKHEKKRTAQWEQIAQRIGADFEVYDTSQSDFKFKLFEKGEKKKMKNHLRWESDGIVVHLSDYQYVTYSYSSRGRTATTHRQTICVIEKSNLDFPATFLRKSVTLIDWVGGKIGFQDIDFPEDEEFSKSFILKGDEVRTRNMFSQDTRMTFCNNKDKFKTFESAGNAILINFGKRKPPENYNELVSFAMSVYYLLNS